HARPRATSAQAFDFARRHHLRSRRRSRRRAVRNAGVTRHPRRARSHGEGRSEGTIMAAHSEALICGRYRLSLDRPLVMGVLNITPDSFADGGVFLDLRDATDRVRQMLGEGADIVDIGGESTRPGAVPTAEAHELDRVIPL